MEDFFSDEFLNQLFNELAPIIKAEGHKACEKRRENRGSAAEKKKKGTIDFSNLTNEKVNSLYR